MSPSLWTTFEKITNYITLNTKSTKCEETTIHSEKKYQNKINTSLELSSPYASTIGRYHFMPSCSGAFKYTGLGSAYYGYYNFTVNNGYKRTPVDWVVEYDINATIGNGVVVDCKLFFK